MTDASRPLVAFNRPAVGEEELDAIKDVLTGTHLSGDGSYTVRCETWLSKRFNDAEVMLTHSCTAALELAALLLELGPGDEAIVPSYTFSSTANAIVLTGATPVFADCELPSMNIDAATLEALITPKTKAIFVTHYAGRAPDMDAIGEIAARYDLPIVEDAAQSLGASYNGRQAGTHSAMSTLSFHETKNIISGEGGALVINDPQYVERAAIIREKGTNRKAFMMNMVDKYTWVDVGSSYLPSEITAAFLFPQLKRTDLVTEQRKQICEMYRGALQGLSQRGLELIPQDTEACVSNGHIFFGLLPSEALRTDFLNQMKQRGIQVTPHYIPLHSAIAGERFGVAPDGCPRTEEASKRLIRLPVYFGLDDEKNALVAQAAYEILDSILPF